MTITISTARRRHGQDPVPRIPGFVQRLNEINPAAIRYRINGNRLDYQVLNARRLRGFDQDMMGYIDDERVLPLRFVSRTQDFVDSHFFGTVDIDDLLGGSAFSFVMNMLHILEERLQTPNYATRRRVFARPHQLGLRKERNYLRALLNDPSLRYTGEDDRPGGSYVFRYRSTRGYRVEHLFTTRNGRTVSEVFVVQQNGRRQTLREFLGRA